MPNNDLEDLRDALLAQTRRLSSAIEKYNRLAAELDAQNLTSEECSTLGQIKARAIASTKVSSDLITAGIDLMPDEVITENVHVLRRVLARMERVTELMNEINEGLEALAAQRRPNQS